MGNKITSDNPENREVVIWDRVKIGDTVALGELYDLYVEVLFSFGMQRSTDRNYVMDCIHDLFLDLYKYRSNLAKTDNIRSYLFTSLKRKINRKYGKKVIPVDLDYPVMDQILLKNATSSREQEMIHIERTNEQKDQLAKALNTLTEKQKRGLFLRFDENKSYEEIAKILGVSVETARTLIYRALKALRKHSFTLGFIFSITFF